MRTVGIIAEYNPFHTGHEYHIQKSKEAANADFAVVVMSPDYVQRGEPALFDRHTRAHMALLCGADLVIELPVCYATGSAEYFAAGAVALLEHLGVVDTLCFGAERDDRDRFEKIARILLDEPEPYVEMLRRLLKQGRTFPEARSKALALLSAPAASDPDDTWTAFLASPNNILGIEYCKALKKYKSRITPLPVKRIGSQYNSTVLDGAYCSASAVRQEICSQPDQTAAGVRPYSSILRYIPRSCQELFLSALPHRVTPDDLLPFLTQKLLSSDSFDQILDIGSDLSDRIRALRYQLIGVSWSGTVAALKTRQITQSRIQRALLHVILSIEAQTVEQFRQNGAVYYANVLGFRREASPLLHAVKANSHIPLLTKPSHAHVLLSGCARSMWQQDVYASHLYRSIRAMQSRAAAEPFKTVYETSPVIL